MNVLVWRDGSSLTLYEQRREGRSAVTVRDNLRSTTLFLSLLRQVAVDRSPRQSRLVT